MPNKQRLKLSKALVRHHERDPLEAGDPVTKLIKGGRKLEGTIEHRSGEWVWCRWGRALDPLTRRVCPGSKQGA